MRRIAIGLGLAAGLSASAALAAPAAGDAVAGKAFFDKTCALCHSVEDKSKPLAPTLKGVVGRKVAGAADFKYSDALKAKGGTWTEAGLDTFLKNPQAAVPGTLMPISVSEADRPNVIAYLSTLK